jgi:glycosyltransferase involved in cell wall biosynthesis
MEWLIAFSSVAWIGLLILPWRPWSTRERLEAVNRAPIDSDLSDITILIPARNEEEHIERTMRGLQNQGQNLQIMLVDDQSSDHTRVKAQRLELVNLTIVEGCELPNGWTGKLWALEQGRKWISSSLLLLLDADIELAPGTVRALRDKLVSENLDLVSIMASPNSPCQTGLSA